LKGITAARITIGLTLKPDLMWYKYAASSDAVAAAAPPPALASSLCSEVVEARVHEGLHFRSSGQTISFGDSPQVCCYTVHRCLSMLATWNYESPSVSFWTFSNCPFV